MGVFGETLYEGIIDALDFLKKANSSPESLAGKRAVVVGGGYAAVDAARAAIRLGAEVHGVLPARTEEDFWLISWSSGQRGRKGCSFIFDHPHQDHRQE